MRQSRSTNRYQVHFDRQQERWYVTLGHSATLPLERRALEDLVALYNGIQRGRPLALLPVRTVDALRRERRQLRQTVHQLYDFIDAEIEPPDPPTTADRAAPPERRGPLARLRASLRAWTGYLFAARRRRNSSTASRGTPTLPM